MNTRNVILLACAIIGVGIAACVTGLGMKGFNVKALSTSNCVEQEYSFSEPITGIRLKTTSCDVELVRTNEAAARIVSRHSEYLTETAEVRGGVLTLEQKQNKSFDSFFSFNLDFDEKVTVYLPGNEYDSLDIATASGDVSVPSDFKFKTINTATASGTVALLASCGDINIAAASGDVTLGAKSADSVSIATASGKVKLDGTVISGRLAIKTISGDIELDRCDAGEIGIDTTSGEVEGLLLSGKQFSVKTTSGEVEVPGDTAGAGRCEIHTVSGDVELRVAGIV